MYPCPHCNLPASAGTGCPACGRGPDPDALEVVRLDGLIIQLTARLTAARQAAQQIEGELTQAWAGRNAAAARVRAVVARSAAVRDVAAPAAAEAVGDPSRAKHPVKPSRETSTKLVQNTLFLLGGLLLAVAAIVFTAVAWAQFGVGGRAVLLAFFTGAALAVPLLARHRGLTATAETFAAVGLLLILLDGYAAWYVNLFGVAASSPWGYAAAVCAVTAAVAAAYEHVTGLAGPRFAAVLIAQPVLPLFLVPAHPPTAGWAYVYAGVALLDLTVLVLARGAVRIVGGALAAVAALTVTALATAALTAAPTPARAALAGGALILAPLLPLTAAIRLRRPTAEPALAAASVRAAVWIRAAVSVLAGALVVAIAASAARVAVLLAPAHPLLPASLALLAVALLAATVSFLWLSDDPRRRPTARFVGLSDDPRRRPTAAAGRSADDARVAQGVRAGAAIALVPATLIAVAATLQAAVQTLNTARPLLGAARSATVPGADPRLPLVLAALAAATAITFPAAWRRLIVLSAAALALLALPAALHLPWWTAPILDLTGAAAALHLATRHVSPPPTSAASPAAPTAFAAPPAAAARSASSSGAGPFTYGAQILTALLLTAHAVAAGFGAAAVAAATLAGLSALGLGLAVRTRRGPHRLDLAGPGLLAGLLAWPATAWATAAALTSSPLTQSRVALAAALLPTVAAHVLGRRLGDLRPFALAAALLPAVIAPLWSYPAGDSAAVYAALALLALATLAADPATWFAALLPGAVLLTATAVALSRVLLAPYSNLAGIWSGDRTTWPVPASAPIALLLLAAAAAVATLIRGHRRATIQTTAPILAATIALTVAAAHAPWPFLPATELLLGLSGLLSVAFRRPFRPTVPGWAYPSTVFVLLAGAGLAGAVPTRPATLAALGAVLIAGAVAGVAARTRPARLTGWLSAVAGALGVAVTATDLDRPATAFPVLAVAAATLALSWLLRTRPAESRPVEAAAHAAALLALLVALGSLRATAAVCLVWGIALGVRGLRRDGRDAYLIAAATAEFAAWAQLMIVAHVGTLEAYSIPAAAVALLAGRRSRRTAPRSSWAAYGPALAAALLPSLASIAFTDGQYPRRLLLGIAALAVLLAGARARLQAPVVLGGGVLALVALHELAQVWDLVPRWLPLAAGGLLLVLLAMTLERRRRDLDRLRAALTRLG